MRLLFALLAALAVPAQAAGDPLALHLFSEIDREAVAVGGYVELTVEALAVPRDRAAAQALARAFRQWDVTAQLGPGFAVVRSELEMGPGESGVVEHRRRLRVRVLDGAVAEVPALQLAVIVGGRTWTFATRPYALQTYTASGAVAQASQSVVSVTAEGVLDGVRFQRVGSAFAVGGDALVTAYHVVVGARQVRVQLPNGEVRVTRVWALDPDRDVAVLHLDPRHAQTLRPLVIAPADAPGAVSFTAGWPGAEQVPTVAPRYADLALDGQRVRMAANAVSPGDSGGPLLDLDGRVLGVVVSGRGETGSPDLLREAICLAADPSPALRQYRSASEPMSLRDALAQAETSPAGQAHAAAGTMQLAAQRPSIDRGAHVDVLREALRRSGDDAALQFLAGAALEEAGDPLAASALDASRRGGYVPAGYALAHHLMERGRLGLAADMFAEIGGDGAYRRLAAFGQAQALVGMGRYDQAEVALATVLDHDARFAPALYLLGLVRLSQGRDAEAEALTVRLASRPGWAEALRLPLESAALRPPLMRPLPRVALR